jgi:hypothetical protein
MAATIERAKAEDPKVLRARIAELERDARQRRDTAPDPAAWQAAYQRGREDAMNDFRALVGSRVRALEHAREALQSAVLAKGGVVPAIADVVDLLGEQTDGSAGDSRAEVQVGNQGARVAAEHTTGANRTPSVGGGLQSARTRGPTATPHAARNNGAGELAPSERKILDALALLEELGSPGRVENLAFFAGYSSGGGRFTNLLGALRTKGLLAPANRDGLVALTDAGRAAADAAAHPVRTVDDLHALWASKLPPSEGRVLRALLDVYPRALDKAALGERTGYTETGGRFTNILGRLRSLGAIDYPSRGTVAATEALFPAGLA